MYTYHLGQSLTLLEGAPAPGTAAVYLLSSKELDQNPQLPGLEGVLHHTPSARDARVCKAEVHRDCLSGTVVVPRRGREGDRVAFGYVTDMFNFQFMRFAVFNVADVCVVCGGIAFCIYFLFFYDKLEKKEGDGDDARAADR